MLHMQQYAAATRRGWLDQEHVAPCPWQLGPETWRKPALKKNLESARELTVAASDKFPGVLHIGCCDGELNLLDIAARCCFMPAFFRSLLAP